MSNEAVLIIIWAVVFSPVVLGVIWAIYLTYFQKNIKYVSAYKVVNESGLCYIYEIRPTEIELIGICLSGKYEKRDIERLIDQNEELKGE